MKSAEKRDRIIDWSLFAVMLAFVSAVTLWLFYKQATGSPERYHSDMKAYILEMQGLNSKYSFPYPVFFKLAALFDLFFLPEMAVAVATMFLNSLAIWITKLSFDYLAPAEMKATWVRRVFLSMLVVSLFFISMLYPPTGIYLPGIPFKYVGVFTANPFHNATYMAARPFAILAFLWYGKLLPIYEEGVHGEKGKIRDYIFFSLFLLLATMTKPSFTIVLVGAAGLIMVFRMFRSGFRNLVPTLQLGACFIPTFLDLLYQFKGVFVPKEGAEGGIGFCFGEVWAQYCGNLPLAVCLAIGFPLLVLILNFRELKENTWYRFSWQLYLMSFAMAFLLYEKGFRKPDFNFSWGYMYGIFFCHMGALLVLLRSMVKEKKKPLLIGAQWLAYLGHLVCGIYYFIGFLRGQMYY
ncbi:MAG: hypothetical protein NC420_05430 [Eubacterium sp.]|nr:hypothetical protein [Eubacterium sp.]